MNLSNRHFKRLLKSQEMGSGCKAVVRICLLASIAFSLPGCTSFGPSSVDRDRFDYINAIASSWKQQEKSRRQMPSPQLSIAITGIGLTTGTSDQKGCLHF
jgi:hypothetical protein